jgi:putative transposase
MPRRPRLAAGDLAYHVLNRRVGWLPIFEKPADYAAFEKILAEAYDRTRIRITAYGLMPNHLVSAGVAPPRRRTVHGVAVDYRHA